MLDNQYGEYEELPIGSLFLDETLRIIKANSRFLTIFAADEATLLQQSLDELFSPKDRKGIASFYQKFNQYERGFLDTQITLRIAGKDYYVRLRAKKMPPPSYLTKPELVTAPIEGTVPKPLLDEANAPNLIWLVFVENTLVEQDITQEFLITQERWENIFKNADGGIVILDVKKKILEYNKIFYEIMRFRSQHNVFLSEEALFNKNLFELVDNTGLQWLEQAYDMVAKNQQRAVQQTVWYNQKYLEVKIGAIRLPIKGFVGCFIIFHDLTQRKLAEEKLTRSENKFRTLYENTHDAVLLIADENVFLDCNSAALSMFGCQTKEQFLTYHVNTISPPHQLDGSDSLTAVKEYIQLALRNGSHRFEWQHQRLNGENFATEVLLNAFELDGKSVLQAVIRDISERKQSEKALRENQQLLKSIIDNTPALVYVKDLQGHYLLVNQPWSTILQFDDISKILGSTDHDLFEPKIADELRRNDNWIASHQTVLSIEEEVYVGERLYTFISLKFPLVDVHGKLYATAGVSTDITERKLVEQQIQQANQQLKYLNQEKNEFLGIVAHDLKNPLAAIQGSAELIEKGFDDFSKEEIIDFAKIIGESSQRLFELIKNLLDVNAIESGNINLSLKKLNLLPILITVVESYRKAAVMKNINLYLDTKDLPNDTVCLDKNTAHQIFDNLISNAIKYSPSNKRVWVRMSTRQNKLRLEIQDEGQGLSEADQKKLFGKFTRLTPQPTSGEHSTGLGLFIVKRLVEAMHGQVWCVSELGKGSTFIVEFPQEVN
jgi:PAS domain S-box-containing protein